MNWIKIDSGMFDNIKFKLIESRPNSEMIEVIWVKLLCLCGKMDNGGVLTIGKRALTQAEIATLINRTESDVNCAFEALSDLGMIEMEENTYIIKGWIKHQNTEKYERVKERQKEYQKSYRERTKQKLSSASTAKSLANGENLTLSNSLANVSAVEEEEEKDKETEKENKKRNADVVVDSADDSGASDTLARYATENITCMTTANLLELMTYTDDMSEELIRHAIDIACGNGKPIYNYVKAILNNYAANGWKHIADVKANDRYGEKAKTDDGATWARSEIQFIDSED